ncbi:MAG: TIGR03790 family protein [Candidatus Auribacterota bacterium]
MNLFKILLSFHIFLHIADTYAIQPPFKVSASAGNAVIELNWSSVPGAMEYDVYKKAGSDTSFTLETTRAETSYRDENVLTDTTYEYYIIAEDNDSQSVPSQILSATPHSEGTFAYYRLSDYIYYFNPWLMNDNSVINTIARASITEAAYTEDAGESFSVSMQSATVASPSICLSEDRKWLYYATQNTIYKKNMLNGEVFQVTSSFIESEYGFSLSPDSNRLVYVKQASGKSSLYMIDSDGGNETELLRNGKNNRYPVFSPDGTHVLFVSRQVVRDDLYTINITTKSVTQITSSAQAEQYPCYSPDGTKIAFQASNSQNGTYDIYTVSSSGTNLTAITSTGDHNEYFPAWSPDGTQLAFIYDVTVVIESVTRKYFHIVYKNADGTGDITYHTDSSHKLLLLGLCWQGKTDVMPPSAILDLSSGTVTSESAELSFSAPGDDGTSGQADQYTFIYSEEPIIPDTEYPSIIDGTVPLISGSAESRLLEHLKANTQYYIAIQSSDDQGNVSDLSNIITILTQPSDDSAAPSPPTNITVTPSDYLRMVITWNHSPSSDTAGYTISRNGNTLANLAYTTEYIDEANSKDTLYTYTVTAFDENGNLSTSTAASGTSKDATIPPAPDWLRVYNEQDSVRLRWEPIAVPDISGYKIYRQSGSTTTLLGNSGISTQFTDSTGTVNQTYTYYVTAVDTAGNESQPSKQLPGTAGWTDAERTLVLMNMHNPVSLEIGEYYQNARGIPESNMITLNTYDVYNISAESFIPQIYQPVYNYITQNGLTEKIRFIATTRGIPIKVTTAGLSTDAVLADLFNSNQEYIPTVEDMSASVHPYYLAQQRFTGDYNMILTARLDGPSIGMVKDLIDRSLYAEKYPQYFHYGSTCLDERNITPNAYDGGYAQAERFIKTTAVFAKDTVIVKEKTSALFANNSCTDPKFYYGWYSYWNFKDIFADAFLPGSIAGHLDSASFQALYNTGDNNWGIHLITRGATAVYGSVSEPYTLAFPAGGILHDRLNKGFNLAESYWCASNTLRWRMILLGDPLFNPHANTPDNDTTAPIISNVSASPAGYNAMSITWDTDEITDHAVTYFTSQNDVQDSGYTKWYSRHSRIILSGIEPGIEYSFYVTTRDPAGNETISDTGQFTYTDSDNDGLEDSWETTYFSHITAYAGFHDPDCDAVINFDEFRQGTNPLSPEQVVFTHDSTATKVSFSTSDAYKYRIYYSNTLGSASTWTQAGPDRAGTGSTITWTDDGRNTGSKPQSDPSLEMRFYKITSELISR